MGEQDGLICAYRLDGRGDARQLDWEGIRNARPEAGALWIHLNRDDAKSRHWLQEEAGVEPLIYEALVAEETRPRCTAFGEGLLLILRGVNLNPGADPEDMVSVRMWIEPQRIISVRLRRLMAIQDIREGIAKGVGPRDVGDFVVQLSDRLIDRMGSVLEDVDDAVDELEEEVIEAPGHELRMRLGFVRRQAIKLRRYIAPQRDVMSRLQGEQVSWLTPQHRGRLREIADRITRYVEDLDECRDRAAVIHDELESRHSEQMNKTMYVLSLVAAIFLPLGLLTGLLGINVGGIPGADNKWAFDIVVLILAGIAGFLVWLFHRKKWL